MSDPNLKTPVREGGVELLRLVLMGFIIGHHVLVHGAGLFDASAMDGNSWGRLALNSFFVIAVDAFVLISGYFSIKLKSLALIKLLSQTWFYGLVLMTAFVLWGGKALTQDLVLLSVLPVSGNLWWFITNYVYLMLVSPLLNRVAFGLDRRHLGFVVLGLLLLNNVIGFYFSPANIWGYSGYSLTNFISIYMVGLYLKRYHTILPGRVYFWGWLAATAGIFVASAVMIFTGQAGYVFSRAFAYNSPLLVFSAICLFFWFKSFKLQAGWVFALSPLVLGVYLIHDHPFIREVLYKSWLQVPQWAHEWWFFVLLPLVILGILGAALVVEKLRSLAFASLEKQLADKAIFKTIDTQLAAIQPPKEAGPAKP